RCILNVPADRQGDWPIRGQSASWTPSSGRKLVSLAFVMALLLLAALRLSRREQTAAATDERMVSKAANDTTIRHIALAVGGVAAALAVMGGSLALALGALGDEHSLPTRPPSAVVGGGGGAAGGSPFRGQPRKE